jgi:hypothetical protein
MRAAGRARATRTQYVPTTRKKEATDFMEHRDTAGRRGGLLARLEHHARRFADRYCAVPGYDTGAGEAPRDGLTAAAVRLTGLTPRNWLWVLAAVASAAIFFAGLSLGAAEPAFAQQDGGRIQSTIDNARNWLAGIMVSLGGLGMIASMLTKAVARTNENMHHAAHMGMTGSGVAIVAGLLVNDIINLLRSFVGGG